MVERICPTCQHGNPVTDHYCGKCGAPLERLLPARRSEHQLTIAGRELPVTWRQVGRTVALGVAALAAEVGIAMVRRYVEGGRAEPGTALVRRGSVAPPASGAASVVTIVSQRVVEIVSTADGRRISETSFWRKIEE